MPLSDTRHPLFQEMEFNWYMVRSAIGGSQSIKRANSLFLPIPAAMANAPAPSYSNRNDLNGPVFRELETRSPNYHPNPAYAAYKTRAQFPDMTSNTLRGLIGIALKREPIVELPPSMEYLMDETATATGETLVDLFKLALSEVLQTGRMAITLDVNSYTGRIYMVPYAAETFINWRSGFVKGQIGFNMMVFEEEIYGPIGDDPFGQEKTTMQRAAFLDADGIYTVQTYADGAPLSEPIQPAFMGRRLDFIPNVVIGSTNFDSKPDIVPLAGLAETAVHIYMKNADLSQSQYMTANPLLAFLGVRPDDVPNVVGATVAIAIPNEAGDVKYVEVAANGLNSIQASIDKLFEQAMAQGAALLGGTSKAAEAAEAIRLRQEASGATLKGVVEQCGRGIEKLLKQMAVWMGENPDSVVFDPLTEFSEHALSAPEQQALLQMWMNKGISYETFFDNLKAAGIAEEDRTAEEELAAIESEAPVMLTPSPELQAPPMEDDEDEPDDENDEPEDDEPEEMEGEENGNNNR
jgi:hypothetical protein